MKKIRNLAVLNTVAFLIQLAASWLTQFKLINAKDVGEVSDQYPTLFTPASITFSIWGLIYLLLAAFCIYHLIMAWRQDAGHSANRELKSIGGLFILNNLATAAWLLAWTHEALSLSLLLIAIQLLTLIAMNGRLRIYDSEEPLASRIFTQLPLAVYFGWITIATLANTDAWLFAIHWNRMGISAVDWTLLLIGVAVFVTLMVVLARRNIFYGLVVIWALIGIVLKLTEDLTNPYPDIVLAAEIGMIIVGIACLVQLARASRTWGRKTYTPFPLAPHSLK